MTSHTEDLEVQRIQDLLNKNNFENDTDSELSNILEVDERNSDTLTNNSSSGGEN